MAKRRANWDRHAIKAEIYRRGWTLSSLAEAYGLNPSAVRVALVKPFPAADQAISNALGKPLHVLWPKRYDRCGNRKYTNANRRSTASATKSCLNDETNQTAVRS